MKIYLLEQNRFDVPPGDRWLGGRERETLSQLRIPKRRSDWLLGRWTAKLALAVRHRLPRYEESLAKIEIVAATSGAPEAIAADQHICSAISLSHSCAVATCAVADPGTPLGCDLEEVTIRSPAFLEDYFTPAERCTVARSAAEDRASLVTLMWSAKESTLKALHCGLRADTRSVCVVAVGNLCMAPAAWQPLTTLHESGGSFFGWWRKPGRFIETVVTGCGQHGQSEFPISLAEELR